MTPAVYYDDSLMAPSRLIHIDTVTGVRTVVQVDTISGSRGAHVRPASGSSGKDAFSKRWLMRAFFESDFRLRQTDDFERTFLEKNNPRYHWVYEGRMLRGDVWSFNSFYGNQLLTPATDHSVALIKQLASSWTSDEVGYQETVGQLKSTIGTYRKLTLKTAKLLGRTVPTIAKSRFGPKKGRREWARQEARRLLTSPLRNWRKYPALWLEWNFGIAPVARDAEAAVSRLNEMESRLSGTPYWSAYLRKVEKFTQKQTSLMGPDVYVRPVWNIKVDHTYAYTTGVAMHFRIPRYVCGQYGGGQLSPLGTAWAFVPYSWLIDYVIPIGSWLQGMELAQVAPYFVEGSVSRKALHTASFGEIKSYDEINWPLISAKKPAVLKLERSDFKRTLMIGFPYAELLKPPTVNLDLSIFQLSLGLSALVRVVHDLVTPGQGNGWSKRG